MTRRRHAQHSRKSQTKWWLLHTVALLVFIYTLLWLGTVVWFNHVEERYIRTVKLEQEILGIAVQFDSHVKSLPSSERLKIKEEPLAEEEWVIYLQPDMSLNLWSNIKETRTLLQYTKDREKQMESTLVRLQNELYELHPSQDMDVRSDVPLQP